MANADYQGIMDGLMGKADKIEELAQSAQGWETYSDMFPDAKENYGTHARFRPFTKRNPADFDGGLEQLDRTQTTLADPEISTNIEIVKDKTEDWQGKAAEDFTEFMSGFDARVLNQVAVVTELQAILQASQSIVQHGIVAIDDIADTTIEALEQYIENKEEAKKNRRLQIIGAALTIAAGVTTLGGAAFAGALTIAAGTAAGYGAMEANIAGKRVFELMDSHQTAVRELNEAIDNEEQFVVDKIIEDMSSLDENIKAILPKRPNLASIDEVNDDFALPTHPGS